MRAAGPPSRGSRRYRMMPLASVVMRRCGGRVGGARSHVRIRPPMTATCTETPVNRGPRMASRVGRVLRNERDAGGCHHLVVSVEGTWPDCGPGQFAMLSTDHPQFPILPRPFSLLGG